MNNIYKKFLRIILGAVFTLCCVYLHAQTPAKPQGFTPGKVLIKFRSASFSTIQNRLSLLSRNSSMENFRTGILRMDAVGHQFKATKMTRVFPNAGKMEVKQHKYGLDRWYSVKVDSGVAIPEAIKAFRQIAEVETAQPAYTIKSISGKISPIIPNGTAAKPLGVAKPLGTYTAPFNDPLYQYQWHYHNDGRWGGYVGADMDLEPAWKINAGKPQVIVDVVDEGVDYKHEDLAANMWVNQAELNGYPGYDDDGNGYIDDIYGYNFADNTNVIVPGDHGTHTSGTIAAVNNNGIGVCGIAGGTGIGDGARIMSSEIFGDNGADGAATAAAIVYGANNGAVISQNSWGYTAPDFYDQAVLDAMDYFTKEAGRDANGVQVGPMNGGVVIFAAGNSSDSTNYYPGYYPTAIAVGATSIFDNKASYSNFGSCVDISAPGGDDPDGAQPARQEVASTTANNTYGYMAGTSMATPHVSGVAALIVSQFGKPGFTNEDLKNRLFGSVSPFIAMDPYYNGKMGVGKLDAGKALQSDKAIPPNAITDLKGVSNAQTTIDLSWTSPVDPDNGNAAGYYVYYSTHAIDSTMIDTLTKIYIKKALAAGSTEVYTLTGLRPSTLYYTRILSKDLWGNVSPLSNTATATTMPGAVISLPTDTIRMNINVTTNPVSSSSLQITNTGQGSMNWTGTPLPVSSNWARPDGFNDTLGVLKQDYPDQFFGDDAPIYFSAATRFDVSNKAFNLTNVASYIYTTGVVAPITIFVYRGGSDPSKGVLLLKQTMGDVTDYALNITKLNGMFLFQPGEWFWIVYQYDPAFYLAQGYVNYPTPALSKYNQTSSDQGLTWAPVNGVWSNVRFFIYGLSNEGYHGSLVSMSPVSGTIPGLGNSIVGVNGNATTVRNGVYNYNLQVQSNDVNTPFANTPMVVTVSGQIGTLMSKQGILDCSTVFIGKGGDATITLYNAGLSTLSNFAFTSSSNKYTAASLPDSLYPGDSTRFTVTFTPTATGQVISNIKLTTNDGTLKLSATGVGIRPPVMDLTGIPLQIVAKPDSTGKNSFTISNNNGKYPLSYSMPEIAAISKARAQALARGTDPSFDYAWIDNQEPDGPVFTWDDISTTGLDITHQLSQDRRTSALEQLGFRMKFYGDTISQIYVNSFGALSLNYPGAMSTNSSSFPIPNDGLTGTIAGLFFETEVQEISGTERVYIKYLPGKFIVQYNDIELTFGNFFDYGSWSAGKCTFQIVLNSNGRIEMNYKTVDGTWGANGTGMIGLENKAETKGVNLTDYNAPSQQQWYPTNNSSLWWVPAAPKYITSISPLSGAVAIGDSVKINVTASAAGLVDSTYQSSIALTTNDPLNEQVNVPVALTVTGAEGMMLKTDSLVYGSIYKNGTATQTAILLNAGTKAVKLLSTALSNPAYSITQDTVTVPAFSELRIPVTFSPVAETSYNGTLTVVTDDSTFTVQLSGTGKASPSMTYNLSGGQTNALNMGDTKPASLNVTNNGDGDLKIMIEIPQWLEMNQAVKGVGNGLDSAHTYSIHKNIDSSSAAYQWFEIAANGLGTKTLLDPSSIVSQPLKMKFAFPFFGKTYQTLYANWLGDAALRLQPPDSLYFVRPTMPSPNYPNGYLASANIPFIQSYDYNTQKYVGGTYYYADTDKLVIEQYQMYGTLPASAGKVTFETIYYKDGRVKMLYQTPNTYTNFTQQFFVGIENEDGSDGALAFNKGLWYKNHGVIEFVPSIPYTLKPGQSVDFPASWTTKSMTDGVYTDYLTITTNDPLNSSIHIPLELDVNGAISIESDSVKFGNVIAYTSDANGPMTYVQPMVIRNKGTKTVTINSIDMSNSTSLYLLELNDYTAIEYPLILGPGDELLYHIQFTPDSTMSSVNETLNVSTDGDPIIIPVTATVNMPPVVTTDSSLIRVTVQKTDTAMRSIQFGNIGRSALDYSLSVQYQRPGIAYNSITPAKPLPAKKNDIGTKILGTGPVSSILGNQGGPLGGTQNFADSLLAFDPSNPYTFYWGNDDDGAPMTAVTRFNGGKKGFYLSHVGNLYRTDRNILETVKLRIRLGSNINTSTVILEQDVVLQPDTTGHGIYVIVKLDSSILINAYEDFFVEWAYAPGMRHAQGCQFIPSDQLKNHTFYTTFPYYSTFSEFNQIGNFLMAAYAQTDSSGGWLTIAPDTSGSLAIGQQQQISLTVHGPKVDPIDQRAMVFIHSNDPVTPDAGVSINVHIDQAPIPKNHDTLRVNEADTLNALIEAMDDGGGKVTINLVKADTAASINHTADGDYFVYHPGYNDAGVHIFPVTLADDNGNKRIDSLIVLVTNTNRPPVVVRHLKDRTISLQGAALQIALDSVFMDPDGDTLKYSFAGPDNSKVKVFVDTLGATNIIPTDTGHISLIFAATDPYGASAWDTLHLYIKNNTAPVATEMPDVVIDKNTSRTIELSQYFNDADSKDVLSFTASMDSLGNALALATMGVNGSELNITGLVGGTCRVTVTADDGNGGTVSRSFTLVVLNDKGNIVDDYHITVGPNPVHATTTIKFDLGTEKKVQIDLISMDGKIQSQLFEGTRSAGYHTMQVNLSNIADGNYLLKFTIGDKEGVIQIAKL